MISQQVILIDKFIARAVELLGQGGFRLVDNNPHPAAQYMRYHAAHRKSVTPETLRSYGRLADRENVSIVSVVMIGPHSLDNCRLIGINAALTDLPGCGNQSVPDAEPPNIGLRDFMENPETFLQALFRKPSPPSATMHGVLYRLRRPFSGPVRA